MKVPTHEFKKTVDFYRNVLGFEQIDSESSDPSESVTFKFGDKNLWIDHHPGMSQAEIWLEVIADDIEAADNYLKESGCVRCDDVERLPDGFKGFWIANPANIIHLISD